MTKVMCDICGKEMDLNAYSEARKIGACITIYGTPLDMCKECRKTLNDWIMKRKHTIHQTEGSKE